MRSDCRGGSPRAGTQRLDKDWTIRPWVKQVARPQGSTSAPLPITPHLLAAQAQAVAEDV